MKTCGVDDFTVKDVENLHDNYSEATVTEGENSPFGQYYQNSRSED